VKCSGTSLYAFSAPTRVYEAKLGKGGYRERKGGKKASVGQNSVIGLLKGIKKTSKRGRGGESRRRPQEREKGENFLRKKDGQLGPGGHKNRNSRGKQKACGEEKEEGDGTQIRQRETTAVPVEV